MFLNTYWTFPTLLKHIPLELDIILMAPSLQPSPTNISSVRYSVEKMGDCTLEVNSVLNLFSNLIEFVIEVRYVDC